VAEPTYDESSLQLTSRLAASEATVSEALDGGLVVLDRTCGALYTLNGVGAFAWAEMNGFRTLEQIAGSVAHNFDIDLTTASRDLLEWARHLLRHRLVSVAVQP
jgi:hypothetical protein